MENLIQDFCNFMLSLDQQTQVKTIAWTLATGTGLLVKGIWEMISNK